MQIPINPIDAVGRGLALIGASSNVGREGAMNKITTAVTEFRYDSKGSVVSKHETIVSSEASLKTQTSTHFFEYDSLGQVAKDRVYNLETGSMADKTTTMNTNMDYNSPGEVQPEHTDNSEDSSRDGRPTGRRHRLDLLA